MKTLNETKLWKVEIGTKNGAILKIVRIPYNSDRKIIEKCVFCAQCMQQPQAPQHTFGRTYTYI